MTRTLFGRLVAALLIGVVGSGGGGLPGVDGIPFHSFRLAPESARPHCETTSGCHAGGCVIRSTAQDVRFAPVLAERGHLTSLSIERETAPALPTLEAPARDLPLSRAPAPTT